MKISKTVLLTVTALFIIGALSYDRLFAEQKSGFNAGGPKIAVVSVRTVFQKSAKNKDYKDKMQADQDQIIGQLEKLSKEIDALQADLKTRKQNSEDYLKLMKEISEKKATLDSQKEYYQQQFQIKDQSWTEKLYLQVLAKVALTARAKGFDLVLEKDDIELPATTATELMLIIRTHKVLYYNDNMDITSDVLAAVDADTSNAPVDTNSLKIKMK
jgi:Skp family chaperone for outer membrane proteins